MALDLRALWQYRELFYFLVWRDVKVRYKQTVIGIVWAILQPFLMMVIFTLFFSRALGLTSEGVPYPIFTFSGLLPWQLFSFSLTMAGTSLVSNERLVSKVYFPKLIIPTAAALTGMVDFMIAFVLLIGMMFFYGIVPTLAVFTLPLFVILAMMTSLGLSYWLSALDVQYRDIRYTIPFLTQIWMFATPIFYSSDIVPEHLRLLYNLNPMVGVVNGFRWALLGRAAPPAALLIISVIAVIVLFVSGLYYFRRTEKYIADVV
jgi:lipopolysaccharide transport system permease protein